MANPWVHPLRPHLGMRNVRAQEAPGHREGSKTLKCKDTGQRGSKRGANDAQCQEKARSYPSADTPHSWQDAKWCTWCQLLTPNDKLGLHIAYFHPDYGSNHWLQHCTSKGRWEEPVRGESWGISMSSMALASWDLHSDDSSRLCKTPGLHQNQESTTRLPGDPQ